MRMCLPAGFSRQFNNKRVAQILGVCIAQATKQDLVHFPMGSFNDFNGFAIQYPRPNPCLQTDFLSNVTANPKVNCSHMNTKSNCSHGNTAKVVVGA